MLWLFYPRDVDCFCTGHELHRVATCPSQHHREETSPVAPHGMTHHLSRSDTSTLSHTEWHTSLVELLVDDMLEYAKEFPLQIRWIYSELQVEYLPPLLSLRSVGFSPWRNFFCYLLEMSRTRVDQRCVVQPPLPSRNLPVPL